MVKHYNTSISEDAARILNSKQGQFLGDDVTGPVAVIDISPYANVVRNILGTSTGTGTLYTTPTDKDFYLTSVQISVQANAACDSTFAVIRCTIEGIIRNVIGIAKLTLTATSEAVSITFTTPVKIDRGTAIQTNNTFTAGSQTISAQITGYTVETTK